MDRIPIWLQHHQEIVFGYHYLPNSLLTTIKAQLLHTNRIRPNKEILVLGGEGRVVCTCDGD